MGGGTRAESILEAIERTAATPSRHKRVRGRLRGMWGWAGGEAGASCTWTRAAPLACTGLAEI